MRSGVMVGALMAAVVATGCQTTNRSVLSIPVTRDYQDLPDVSVDDAAETVARARQAGAQHSAPYEYYSAEQYLDMARNRQGERDKAGARDYAGLAKSMAEAALRDEHLMEATADAPALDSAESVRAEFDRLKAAHAELDKEKAAQVSPVLYARATVGLSRAEYNLAGGKRGWRDAARVLPGVGADLRTIAWQDSDGDGAADMTDAAPTEAEDTDGFQDEDGVPDPDNDGDGIPDVVDLQPGGAETRNRWRDFDGAPDQYPPLESVYFGEGSTALSAEAQGYLKGVKQLLDEWPDLKLHAKGYSDNLHSDTYSMEMSQRRAQEVQRYLQAIGVPAERVVATYHGAADPASGTTAEAAAIGENRVDLTFE